MVMDMLDVKGVGIIILLSSRHQDGGRCRRGSGCGVKTNELKFNTHVNVYTYIYIYMIM